MSTIILYKNNKAFRLPILKFISSNKKSNYNTSMRIESNKNQIEDAMIDANKNKKILNLSTLQNISLNSEKINVNNIGNNKEKLVPTIRTSFRDNDKIINHKKYLLNILNKENMVNKGTQKNDDEFIRRRRKLLEKYSLINHYVNNVYLKKKELIRNKIINFTRINKSTKFNLKKIKNRRDNKLKSNLNKEQERTENDYLKKNIANFFHNDLIIDNIYKEEKMKLKNENFTNNIRKNFGYLNNSLPNIFFNLNNRIFLKESRDKLIKSNGKFFIRKIKIKRQNNNE